MNKFNITQIKSFVLSEQFFKIIFTLFWILLTIISFSKLYFILPNDLSNESFLTLYKFFTPDSFDWIINAKYFDQLDTTSIRQPGFTLITKLLLETNTLWLMPVINQFIFLGILFATYQIILSIVNNDLKNKYLSLLLIFLLFENTYLQLFSNLFLSDFYAIFFYAFSIVLLFKNKLKLSAFTLGISWLFQNFVPITIPFFLLYIFLNQKINWRLNREFLLTLKQPATCLVLFLIPSLPWFIYKLFAFGSPFYTHLDQAGLVQPNGNSFLYYFINGTSLFGFFFIPIIIICLYKLGKENLKSKTTFLALLLIISLLFWTVIYEWNDRRFLLYLIPVIIPLIYAFFVNLKLQSYSFALTIILLFINTTTYFNPARIDTSIPLTHWEALNVDYSSLNASGENELKFSITRQSPPLKSLLFPSLYNTYQQRNYYRNDSNSIFAQYQKYIEVNYHSEEQKLCTDQTKFPINFYQFNNIFRYKTGHKFTDVKQDQQCFKNF